MKKITKEELKTILEQHELWLDSNEKEGKRADLSGANLSGANLSYANLFGVNLTSANLSGADLTRANLFGVNLTSADLSSANLSYTYLTGANLTRANLSGADLRRANLYSANLYGANLTGADLRRAELTYADLTDTILDEKEQCRKGIVLTESMVGYKKASGGKIITLELPIGAKVFSINNNKRRTNKAKVIDMQGKTKLSSKYNTSFKYHIGDEIDIIDFNENYNVECGEGIHFFLTRDEAENF